MDNNFSLFNSNTNNAPLAERLRPEKIEDFVGQEQITDPSSIIGKMIETKEVSSFILWGPPGVGKTTLAHIISQNINAKWNNISAVMASIKDVKKIMEEAEKLLSVSDKKTVIFIDEIHRFNKAQQDAFLPYVEKGTVILIGATTENPSFSIISPLLSRMKVIVLNRLDAEDLTILIDKAIKHYKDNESTEIIIDDSNKKLIAGISSGDARRCYGIIEQAVKLTRKNNKAVFSKEIIEKVLQTRLPSYDKKGDMHFDYISALHKSMRNSDADAAVYYTVKMLESGEDPLYILRRVIQHSSEDVGMADPNALTISISARDTVQALGMPEARFAILEAVVYNALAPKSNSLMNAYLKALEDIKNNPDLPVPLHLRNAPTKLMKELNYNKGYQYAHDYDIPITAMQCLPDMLKDREYYIPKDFGFEKKLKERHEKIKSLKKNINPKD